MRKMISREFVFAEDEHGVMKETNDSIVGRICSEFGFNSRGIVLMEASFAPFKLTGSGRLTCDSASFASNGFGWTTDFSDIARDTAFDDEAIRDA